MPANTAPIFSLTPNNGKTSVTAALTKSDGTGTIATDIFKLFTAGSNGSYVGDVRFSIAGNTAATNSTATVARVYLATTGTGATTGGTNTFLLAEVALPAQSTDSTTTPTFPAVVPLNRALASGEFLLVSTHHAPAANTAVHATCNGGDFYVSQLDFSGFYGDKGPAVQIFYPTQAVGTTTWQVWEKPRGATWVYGFAAAGGGGGGGGRTGASGGARSGGGGGGGSGRRGS